MRTRWLWGFVLGVIGTWTPAVQAQTDLQKKLRDTGVAAHWIYNDIAKGFAEPRATGKPLLVSPADASSGRAGQFLRAAPCGAAGTRSADVVTGDAQRKTGIGESRPDARE